ncbi:hypothetical protein M8J75_007217 [Diaphorina citri]|nr:hypothetical protein M8J75_007217 [Diaphorina citri]
MAKEKAWKDVEALFNAQSGGTFRNASSLKNKWALLKKRAKQEAAAIRYNSIATGGGPSTSKEPLPRIFEEVIGICSPMSIMGSSGGPCSDGEPLAKSEQISKEVIVEEVSVSHFLDHLDYEIEEVKDSGNNNNDNDRKNNDSDEDDDGNTNTNNNCNWNKYTPAMLRQPKSLKLRNKTPVSKKRNCDQYKENLSVKKNILSLQEEHLHMMIAEQKREDAFKEENRQYKRIEHQLKIAAMKEEYELAIKHRREEHNMKMELLKKGIWPSNQMNLPN